MGSYRSHIHSLEEIDIACRLWGAPGMQRMLDGQPPAERAPTEPLAGAARVSEPALQWAGLRAWLALRRWLRPGSRRAEGDRSLPEGRV